MTTQQKAGAGVLAELDLAIGRNIERGAAKGSPSDKSLREVRAAVGELIEAHRALLLRAKTELVDPEDVWEIEAAESALARVGGAQ